MIRTQISLTEEQHHYLKTTAGATGESLSAILRRALDEHRRRRDRPVERALAVLGAFEADRDDVSERHDEYLAMEEAP
jgi:hypothetical protein